MKRFICIILCFLILTVPALANELYGDAKSVILMEASTKTVLYEYEADKALPPASVTKIMTLLLVIEAVDRGDIQLTDQVTCSENAASMGGSQIYLEPGETMTVDELIKSVVVASANDAAVALAEYVAGSESAFVELMNKRAGELGMVNTHFENTNGLDDTTTSHLTSSRDIALMSAELLSHPVIFNYTTIWMDTVRNGQFGLTNTNRLIKFYNGANGLKTGSTSHAGFCISATALRDDMQLIAVIMGASTRDSRNATAQTLLDYGFANYCIYSFPESEVADVPVYGGTEETLRGSYHNFSIVREKNAGEVTQNIEMNENITAPIAAGDVIGRVYYQSGDEVIHEEEIVASVDVEKLNFFSMVKMILCKWCVM